MFFRSRIAALALAGACFSASRAAAEPTSSIGIFIATGQRNSAGWSIDEPPVGFLNQPRKHLDYTVFAYELLAYVAKEVLHDSPEEYVESPIGSRLSREMPDHRSEFGSHCLMVITELRSGLSGADRLPSLAGTAGAVDYAVEAAGAALAVQQIWAAFRNDLTHERSGLALDPKVGARKVGLYLTFRW